MRYDLNKLRKTAQRVELVTGIYFLFLDDELVYIGKSVNVISRIGGHLSDPLKTFTHFTFVPVPLERLAKEELRLIRRFRPRLNRSGINEPKPLEPRRELPPRERIPHPYRSRQELVDLWFPESVTPEDHQRATDTLARILRPD